MQGSRMQTKTVQQQAAPAKTIHPGPYAPALQPFSAKLDGVKLLRAAEQATGLSDWGGKRWEEERFRHDFARLCDAIEATADVSDAGRSRTHSRLFTMLVSRLRYLDARNSLAGVDDQRITAPLIGSGMPRAGTTFLHGLLAQDPANRVARSFESAIPTPWPSPERDEREALYHELLQFQGLMCEEVTRIHPYYSSQPEECIFIQEGDCGPLYNVYWNVPAYQVAVSDKIHSALRWQIGVMQYMQAIRPGGRWSLKAPGHMFNWDEVRMAFPDALIYINHRDPGKVTPSIASLFMALRGVFSDNGADPMQVGAWQLQAWGNAARQYADWRAGPGKDANIADVHFSDLTARPLETVAALYDRFDIPFSDAARDAMLRHMETDHHGKGPGRVYTLAEFGMSEESIEAAFGQYIDYFQIRREKRA